MGWRDFRVSVGITVLTFHVKVPLIFIHSFHKDPSGMYCLQSILLIVSKAVDDTKT